VIEEYRNKKEKKNTANGNKAAGTRWISYFIFNYIKCKWIKCINKKAQIGTV
jgi:hypothetical protein